MVKLEIKTSTSYSCEVCGTTYESEHWALTHERRCKWQSTVKPSDTIVYSIPNSYIGSDAHVVSLKPSQCLVELPDWSRIWVSWKWIRKINGASGPRADD